MTQLVSLLLTLPALLAACGGNPDDPEWLVRLGEERLAEEDPEAALRLFGRALAALDGHGDQFPRASLGLIEAMANTSPSRAASRAHDLEAARPEALREADFVRIAARLSWLGEHEPALGVLMAGHGRHPLSTSILDAWNTTTHARQREAERARARGLQEGTPLNALRSICYTNGPTK